MVKSFTTDSTRVLTEFVTNDSSPFLVEFKEESFTQVKFYMSFD